MLLWRVHCTSRQGSLEQVMGHVTQGMPQGRQHPVVIWRTKSAPVFIYLIKQPAYSVFGGERKASQFRTDACTLLELPGCCFRHSSTQADYKPPRTSNPCFAKISFKEPAGAGLGGSWEGSPESHRGNSSFADVHTG